MKESMSTKVMDGTIKKLGKRLKKISYNEVCAVISDKFVETNKYVMWSA